MKKTILVGILMLALGAGSAHAGLIFNEIHADPAFGLIGDANGDGVRDPTEDEFLELVNISGGDLDISGWSISDLIQTRHTFASGTIVMDGMAVVVFGGGTPTGSFGGALVFTASTGTLALNNAGDTITLFDAASLAVASETYGGEGGDNQSLTRDPDLTGAFTKHSTATGSGGSLFSPGTQVDGTAFGVPTPATLALLGLGLLGVGYRRRRQ